MGDEVGDSASLLYVIPPGRIDVTLRGGEGAIGIIVRSDGSLLPNRDKPVVSVSVSGGDFRSSGEAVGVCVGCGHDIEGSQKDSHDLWLLDLSVASEQNLLMPNVPYVAPGKSKTSFNCPRCDAFAKQDWFPLMIGITITGFRAARCNHCKELSVWLEMTMIWPRATTAPAAHPDLPEDCKADYEEASQVLSVSPRSSAALLRLVIQKLMVHLGEAGKSINDDIGALVVKGLSVKIQQALDACRIVGNEAVHPGAMDLNATPQIAEALFGLVNMVVENQIAEDKKVRAITELLPPDKLKGVEDRDKEKA